LEARWAHNSEVLGSNPTFAKYLFSLFEYYNIMKKSFKTFDKKKSLL